MKLIFLNTWNAKQERQLSEFIKAHSEDTDIFCLQEAYEETQAILEKTLVGYTKEYAYAFAYTGEDYAQATYVRNDNRTIRTEILKDAANPRGLGIISYLDVGGRKVTVLNYHGVSRPKHKDDTEERISEMHRLINYFKDISGPKVLGGDFNFLPETNAYKLLIEAGYIELIKANNIATTRNHFYWDNRPENHLYSDYVFVSEDIHVTKLEVPQVEVSDHLPIVLEFELANKTVP